MNRLSGGFIAAIFLVLPTSVWAQSVPLIAGGVLADGTQVKPSKAYSVIHDRTGKYEVVFAQPFPNTADCVVTPVTTQPNIGLVENRKRCLFLFEDSSGKPVDAIFTFIATPLTK